MAWIKRAGLPKIERQTVEIDATGKPIGRLATKVAMTLMGKHRPQYEPHTDMGDRVVIKNADKAILTGKKWEQKVFYRTSNRPGGLKTTPVKVLRAEKPEEVIRHAVVYMLPKNKLQAVRMKRLTFIK